MAIPKNEDEFKLVERLTQEATLRAVERHAGQIRYVYGPSGRQTLAEGKDLTQVKYIVGTGGALTRLPHRVNIMGMIPKDNETGMKLYPSEAVKILVDNDYIMASLGVLSKTHRQGAIRLLGQSLKMDLQEQEHAVNKAQFIEELQRLNNVAKAKEEERLHHIEEMEKMGYDMSEYKNPEKIGGATHEEVEAAKKEALMQDRTVKKGEDLIMNRETADEQERQENKKKAGCDGDCDTCTRRHCPYGKK